MRDDLARRSAWTLACIALLTMGGCASSPESDGGIVGTGNRIDCEALAKKDKTLPEECKLLPRTGN